jgi:hypothetical protein
MRLRIIGIVLLVAGTAAAAAGPLPFGVTLGGQKAKAGLLPTAAFAKIADPVTAEAEIVVDTKEAMVIINIFDCDAKGNVPSSATPAVIILQGTNKGKINNVMSGTAPKSGNHLMNITAGAETARVFFKIQ